MDMNKFTTLLHKELKPIYFSGPLDELPNSRFVSELISLTFAGIPKIAFCVLKRLIFSHTKLFNKN